jgi:predicted choloylglycine hydrolase
MKYIFSIILLLLFLNGLGRACTIFNSFDNNNVLIGNNEDYNDTNVSIRFYPASKGKFGRFLFKIDKNDYPFGGMNDQGLFFDWCSLPRRQDIKFPLGKKNYSGILCEKMLEECASVEEAINLYNNYNDPWLYEGHILVVDKTGASAVIEWGVNNLAIIKKTGHYQVLSNFNLTDPKLAGWYPCVRYNNATKMLDEATEYNLELYKQILNTVHQEGQYPTHLFQIFTNQTKALFTYSNTTAITMKWLLISTMSCKRVKNTTSFSTFFVI